MRDKIKEKFLKNLKIPSILDAITTLSDDVTKGIDEVLNLHLPHDEGPSPVIFALRSPLRAEDELHFSILKNVVRI